MTVRTLVKSSMKRNRDLLIISLLAILTAAVPEIVAEYFNAGYWYTLKSVKISNGPNFDDLIVIVDRKIEHDFLGDFDVAIWPADLSGPVCHGQGRSIPYKASSKETISRTAEWLIGDQSPPDCSKVLKSGDKYIARIVVTIHPSQSFLWWMPLPTSKVWTNIFELTPI